MAQWEQWTLLATVLPLVIIHHSKVSSEEVQVLEFFKDVHVANLTEARHTCGMRGGVLASDVIMDDWDNGFSTDGIAEDELMNTYFSVYISRQHDGLWRHADGALVDMASSKTLVLRETDAEGWDCALWNPWEPYYIPALCREQHPFLCQIPVTQETVCNMEKTDNTAFTGNWAGTLQTLNNMPEDACTTTCSTPANQTEGEVPCWAAEYRASLKQCLLLRRPSKPSVVPSSAPSQGRAIFLKSCKTMTSFPESTCSVLCKCDTDRSNVIIPRTPEEMETFVEEVAEKTKEELVVPTDNLGATVRKYSSATDERSSSQQFGAMGIAMMSMTFGAFMLLDLLSLFDYLKDAMSHGRLEEEDC